MRNSYLLCSDDCELLLEFEACNSLTDLAQAMQRDHSVIARSLKRISESYPVVEKKAGKWILTEMGKRLNEHTRTMVFGQRAVLQSQSTLRIGTNREFSARILGPDFRIFQELFPDTTLIVNSYERGTEAALLAGQIDIGIDCDRPYDPEISYKLVIDEPIVAVASKNFIREHKKEISSDQYWRLPHLLCERLHPDKILSKVDNQISVVAKFNDIATARAACIKGSGWALLPSYSVKEELESGLLVRVDEKNYGKSKYGIFWPRRRTYLKEYCEKLEDWLQNKEL
ncbi:MAG: substrate-binding domain-containing protein [Pseudobdellovibrionaceae bacterium]